MSMEKEIINILMIDDQDKDQPLLVTKLNIEDKLKELDKEYDYKIDLINFDEDKVLKNINSDSTDLIFIDLNNSYNEEGIFSGKNAGLKLFQSDLVSTVKPVIFFTALSDGEVDTSVFFSLLKKTTPAEKIAKKIMELARYELKISRVLNNKIIETIQNINKEFIRHSKKEILPNIEYYLDKNYNDESVSSPLTLESLEGMDKVFFNRIISYVNFFEGNNIELKYRYIYPPIDEHYLYPGTILKYSENNDFSEEDTKWFITLTPKCDLARKGKTSNLLLACCEPLENLDVFKEYVSLPEYDDIKDDEDKLRKYNGTKSRFFGFLKNNPKSYFLPRFRDIPDLVVNFTETLTVPLSWVRNEKFPSINEEISNNYRQIACLSSPYSEDLLINFSNSYSRIGKPDISTKNLETHIKSKYLEAN